ncbi:MAG: DDE-type integrase/transposase/recombinase [Gammaproteobacteria bacterium]
MRDVAICQTARLFELLPQAPNELWQADVTYLHIPGRGWWYAVTVIDYYSRYLLACHFTPSPTAGGVATARDSACTEAERLHGPLAKTPFLVTDTSTWMSGAAQRANGPSPAFPGAYQGPVCPCAYSLPHAHAAWVIGALPPNAPRNERAPPGLAPIPPSIECGALISPHASFAGSSPPSRSQGARPPKPCQPTRPRALAREADDGDG